MIRRIALSTTLVALVGMLGACVTPEPPPDKELINSDFVGSHSVRYLLKKAGKGKMAALGAGSEESDSTSKAQEMMAAAAEASDSGSEDDGEEKVQYYDLYAEVCDIGANREENNCQTSKVLEAIVRNKADATDEEGNPRRQVTDLFWNSSNTLFVSYMAPKPAVKSCTVGDDNTVACNKQPNVNNLLNQTKKMGGDDSANDGGDSNS
jgi:hypothetical protein